MLPHIYSKIVTPVLNFSLERAGRDFVMDDKATLFLCLTFPPPGKVRPWS